MELNPIIKQALVDIDFIGRYQRLSDEYSAEKVPSKERLADSDNQQQDSGVLLKPQIEPIILIVCVPVACDNEVIKQKASNGRTKQ